MIEIILVLLLIGIIAAVAVSRGTQTSSFQVISEAEILKANLSFAQIKALSTSNTTYGLNDATWGISLASSSYTLQKNGTTASVNLPNETSSSHNLPSGITIASGVGTVVTYDVWGSPGTSNKTITLTDGTTPKTITITSNTGFMQ